MCPKINYCIVIDDNGLLPKKLLSKVVIVKYREIKDFINMEKGLIVRNISKLNWKRDLLGVKVPHKVIDCEKCQNDKTCQPCEIDPKLNSFDCEISRSCGKRRITQINFIPQKSTN